MLECILKANRCYTTGTTIKPKGVMVHSTGANNPNLRRYVQPSANDPNAATLLTVLGKNPNANDWNRPTVDACVHAFIGKLADGTVDYVQTLPWNWRGWHAGTGTSGKSANNTHISFEICEDDLTSKTYFDQVYDVAVKLTAALCVQYGLDPLADGVVICHSEGYKRGIASGHADVMHWFPKFGKTMDTFRQDVKKQIDKWREPEEEETKMPEASVTIKAQSVYEKLTDVPDYFRPAIDKVIGAGALQGEGGDVFNLSYDFCRIMTVLDRMGKLD